ncbi:MULTISPECIES: NifU family protein [unclassified Streptomyces]|uniref:NifU family protein n=1 Tax=unclassified Streptomyces TaxID=2593676 RepID=UPI003D72BF8C
MVPLHPQRVTGRPDRLRWIVPAGVLSARGRLVAAPAPLAGLLADGTLAGVTVEPAAVVTRLGAGRDWPAEGARVRTALHAALADPAGWVTAGEPDGDTALAAVARELIGGEVGDFVRSHGGTMSLVCVRDGVVEVRLGGACLGCPAAWATLHRRLESRLRHRYPALVAVRNVGAASARADGAGDWLSHRG